MVQTTQRYQPMDRVVPQNTCSYFAIFALVTAGHFGYHRHGYHHHGILTAVLAFLQGDDKLVVGLRAGADVQELIVRPLHAEQERWGGRGCGRGQYSLPD